MKPRLPSLEDLLAQRIIVLRGAIDDDTATEVIAKLLFLQHQSSTSPVRLHIDSPGGVVAACLAIRDTMDTLGVPVYTHGLTKVQGIAVVLLAHGARGHRSAIRTGRISLTPITRAEDAPHAETDIERTKAIITAMLASDTGQTSEQIDADQLAARHFEAEQARAYGLIDRIQD